MASRRRAQHGFTALEVSVVVLIMALALALFTRNFVSAQQFAEHERARMRNVVARQEGVRTLELLLQAVDPDTLDGFDTGGVATVPSFQRWLYDPADGVRRGPTERLEWREGGDAVGEIKKTGRVFLVSAERSVLVADRVPLGGFRVQREGRRLLIHLETFHATTTQAVARSTSETSIFLGRKDGS
jgi:prepilin-type N-terminal cleavage/methylation domain-containing protein